MTTEQTEETGVQGRPKIQDTAEFKEALRQATSKDQRAASEARKALKTEQDRSTTFQRQAAEYERELEVARLAGDDEEEAARVRARLSQADNLANEAQGLKEREDRVQMGERTAAIRILSEDYGVKAEDLEQFETLAEMKDHILEILKGQAGAHVEISEDPPLLQGPGHDTGVGRVAPQSADWARLAKDDPKEFDRKSAEILREASRRR